jgi:hypothetical protein
MKYLKLFEELEKECIKQEVDLIYRDKDLVCLIPKTQRASYIYGKKTFWCSTRIDTFEEIAEGGDIILFRFIFKDGYKIRLTYDLSTKLMDWSDKSSVHYFEGNKDNPFKITNSEITEELNKYSGYKDKIFELSTRISSIPKSCKDKVLEIIKSEKRVDYKFSDEEYVSPKLRPSLHTF